MNNNKIDFVVTWVDGSDPEWLKEKYNFEILENNKDSQDFKNWLNSSCRYRDWDTMKYWFRAVEKYAPWVNNIYFITWGHIPNWLDTTNPKLKIINHKDYIPKEYLPTYNSNCIELNLFRINDLSEHFVLFNDDFFLNDYVKPVDFFKNNLPRETAAFDCVRLNYNTINATVNNIRVVNKYFKKKDVLKNHFFKWYNIKNGSYIFKTICLSPWKEITGLAELHIASSYNKSYFKKMWEIEYDKFNETCMHRFRNESDINHWLIKDFQLLNGDFIPRSSKFGKSYACAINDIIKTNILNSKYKIISLNDYDCSEEEFLKEKTKLIGIFEKKYPNKSNFEK